MRKDDLSIIIPAYNEEKRISPVLQGLKKQFPDAEIIVVANGCADSTAKIASNFDVKVLEFPKLGKGGAIIQGIKSAKNELIGFIDCDQAVAPQDFAKLVNNCKDAAIASRRTKQSKILIKQPLARRVSSKLFNIIVNLLFNLKIKDTQCGAKVFSKEAVNSIMPLKTTGYEFDVELLWKLKKQGYAVQEIGVNWKDQAESKFSLKNAPKMFVNLLKLRFS